MDIRDVFGRNLYRYRLAAGLSQEAVAERMSVDRAHVSSMERGQQNVTLLTIFHASQAVGVKPAQLLDEETANVVEEAREKVARRPRRGRA